MTTVKPANKQNNIRTLVLSQYFAPESFKINELVSTLTAKQHKIDVLTGLPNYSKSTFFEGYSFFGPYRENYHGANIYRVPLIPRGNKKSLQLALNYISFVITASVFIITLYRKRYDNIFIYSTSPITSAIPAFFYKLIRPKTKIHLWILDLWPHSLVATGITKKNSPVYRFFNYVVKFIYSYCDTISVTSKGFIKEIALLTNKNINYLPQWSELTQENDSTDIPIKIDEAKFNMCFAGNISFSQNLEKVIEALSILDDERLIFHIIGSGMAQETLHNKVKQNHLSDRVIFHGRKPSEDMPSYFKKMDLLLVSLTNDELFALTVPAKLQTYMNAKKPILGFIEGEAAALIKSADCGFTSSPDDEKALAEQLSVILETNKFDLQRMGDNGYIYLINNFNKDKIISNLEELLSRKIC